jgi:hypothetical protein
LITTDGQQTTIIAGPGSQNSLNPSESDPKIPCINNNGYVAFRGYASDGTYDVLVSNGTTTRKIAADVQNGGSFRTIYQNAMSMNDSGTVAFTGSLWSGGAGTFLGDGTAPPTLVISNPTAIRPAAINNSGMVAYMPSSGYGLLKGGQNYTLPGSQLGMPDINAIGTVAYFAYINSKPTFVLADGISPPTYINTSLFAGLGNGFMLGADYSYIGINDSGQVAFMACPSSPSATGIFVGQDPTTDKVIMVGDALDGSTVTQLFFTRDGLNNNGQIAFTAELSNGTQGVFVATAIPEPSTIALLCVAAIGLSAFAWRRAV